MASKLNLRLSKRFATENDDGPIEIEKQSEPTRVAYDAGR